MVILVNKNKNEPVQPQVPLRLPCYDFTRVTKPALDHKSLERSKRLFKEKESNLHDQKRFMVFGSTRLPRCDGRCVQSPRTDSPWHADPRLLVIPAS